MNTSAAPHLAGGFTMSENESIVWDSYVALRSLQDPTSFRIVNETTGECFDSFLVFVASYDVTNRGQGPWADFMYRPR